MAYREQIYFCGCIGLFWDIQSSFRTLGLYGTHLYTIALLCMCHGNITIHFSTHIISPNTIKKKISAAHTPYAYTCVDVSVDISMDMSVDISMVYTRVLHISWICLHTYIMDMSTYMYHGYIYGVYHGYIYTICLQVYHDYVYIHQSTTHADWKIHIDTVAYINMGLKI